MSDIPSLTSQIDQLGSRVDFWNTVIVWCLVATAISATGIVVAQQIAFKRAKQLSDAQDRLIRAKDAQLAIDLGNKDVNIAAAQKEAGAANERAGKLEKEAAELRTKNLELEAAIAPRRLTEGQQKQLAALTAFAHRGVGIKSYANDTEGAILATQISDALSKSGITIEDNRLTMQPAGSISFGVSVDGSDKALVGELKKILSSDGDLMKTSSISSPQRSGVSFNVEFGKVVTGMPLAATITVGAKPIK